MCLEELKSNETCLFPTLQKKCLGLFYVKIRGAGRLFQKIVVFKAKNRT